METSGMLDECWAGDRWSVMYGLGRTQFHGSCAAGRSGHTGRGLSPLCCRLSECRPGAQPTTTPCQLELSGPSAEQSFSRLAGDAGDEVEVLVQVQHREPSKLRGGGDDQVGDRGGTMLALRGQEQLDL